jgi:hypothetical protein
METLIDILLATLFTSYFVGAIDAFIDLKKFKGFIALALSVGVFYMMGYISYDLAILAPGSAFLSLAIMSVLDRPITIQPPRRF